MHSLGNVVWLLGCRYARVFKIYRNMIFTFMGCLFNVAFGAVTSVLHCSCSGILSVCEVTEYMCLLWYFSGY